MADIDLNEAHARIVALERVVEALVRDALARDPAALTNYRNSVNARESDLDDDAHPLAARVIDREIAMLEAARLPEP
jgi:hypothetical protein